MIKTANNAKKLYDILERRFRDFDYDGWPEAADSRGFWEDFLKSKGIEPNHFDDSSYAVDDLMDMINNSTNAMVCADPYLEENPDGDGFLVIPMKLAEKMLVLGALP